MKNVTIERPEYLYEFYRKIGVNSGGIPTAQVISDTLFKLAGELSLEALRDRNSN